MNSRSSRVCPECGAVLQDQRSCQEHFEDLLAREYQDPSGAGHVHHLTVLCYMLQHNCYSDKGREFAITMLEASLEQGVSPIELRQQVRKVVDSTTRKWKVTRSTASTTPSKQRMVWPITIVDVNNGDPAGHNASVTRWAQSVLATIKAQPARVRAR